MERFFDSAIRAAALIYCASQIAACSTVPQFGPMGDPVQITEVVQQVECEIYDTVVQFRDKPKTRWIVDYVGKATLALTVSQDGSVAPEVSLLGPFSLGTFSVLAGGSLKGASERIATYAFTIDFSDVERFRPACSDETKVRLHGSIGFNDWFTRVMKSYDRDDPFQHPTDLSHKLDFEIDAGLKLTPAYELIRSRGDVGLAGNLTLKNSVDFTMTYIDPNGVDYQRVCVVNTPGPCYEHPKFAFRKKTKSSVVSPTQVSSPPAISPAARQRLDNNTLDLQIRSLRLDQFRRF